MDGREANKNEGNVDNLKSSLSRIEWDKFQQNISENIGNIQPDLVRYLLWIRIRCILPTRRSKTCCDHLSHIMGDKLSAYSEILQQYSNMLSTFDNYSIIIFYFFNCHYCTLYPIPYVTHCLPSFHLKFVLQFHFLKNFFSFEE